MKYSYEIKSAILCVKVSKHGLKVEEDFFLEFWKEGRNMVEIQKFSWNLLTIQQIQ